MVQVEGVKGDAKRAMYTHAKYVPYFESVDGISAGAKTIGVGHDRVMARTEQKP